MGILPRLLFLTGALSILPVTGIALVLVLPLRLTLEELKLLVGVLLMLLPIAAFCLTAIATRDIKASLHALWKAHRQFRTGNFNYRIPLVGDRDSVNLFRGFNTMAEFAHDSFARVMREENERMLTEHALQVAHDIRSPLSSLQVAKEYLGNMKMSDPKAPDVLNLLELSAKRLTGIADDLLKKHKGGVINNKIIFSLHLILDELAGEYQGRGEFGGLRFVKNYASQAINLYGDRAKLQRAFGNIIKNAVEAMERRGTIVLSTAKRGETVEISVADTGPGMHPDKLNLILEGGFTEGKSDGHGIGMKVVKETVAEFGGTMKAESEMGKGTRFVITLPPSSTTERKNAQREKIAMESFSLELSSAREAVLVVDDEAGMREQWRLILKDGGMEAILCKSYEDVVRRKLSFALAETAIVDYHFDNSEKSGAEVVQYLQEQGFKRFILCTAEYWKPSIQKLAHELQATLCPKPLPKISIITRHFTPPSHPLHEESPSPGLLRPSPLPPPRTQ